MRGILVEVAPARGGNLRRVLQGVIEELMRWAGDALESLARTATRVVCGLEVAHEWLASCGNGGD